MSQSEAPNDSTWEAFRREMPVSENLAYFDHAAVAPISGPAQRALSQWAEQSAKIGETAWPQWSRRLEEVRQSAATMVSADAEEIGLVRNTTEGIGIVAEGYPWQIGDNVVVPADEFPSNLYPWLNLASRGVETRQIPPAETGGIDLQAVADACDERTRIVAASWVGYAGGWRSDVAELAQVAHDAGALFFLDAIQGLGVFPLDVRQTNIDFFAADGHKWMLGPEGAGLLYMRREHLDLLRPFGVGWNSVRHAREFNRIELDYRPTVERYEGGSQNMPGFHALGASLDLLASIGTERLAARLIELTDQLCERLTTLGATIISRREGERRSGIVSFTLPDVDPNQVQKHCMSEGVVLSCRAGRLRVSPHGYTSNSDLDRLFAALASA